ncbi:L,D-transpeptidase [Paenibacillus kandeliae]|uniref:L,D-transpeptidase n=1 Tax=Paenibacillus kandeliae TaxID=3231269 RepID=UPI00345A5886
MKNLLYLKRYVKMHPDNRMGWYLLGKEYESDGQMGKANYCYNRAGDIYEAFEQSQIPADVLKQYEAEVMQVARVRERKIRRRRNVMLGVLLLFLLTMRSVGLPAADDSQTAQVSNGASSSSSDLAQTSGGEQAEADQTPPGYHAPISFTAAAMAAGSSSAGDGLSQYIAQQVHDTQPKLAAVLGMEQSGQWLLWKHTLPVAYTLAEGDKPGQIDVQSYNAKACRCQPGQPAGTAHQAASWMQQQEQLAVMQTALANYQTTSGQLPTALGQLDRSFPVNWLSGTTQAMDTSFSALQPYPLDDSAMMPEQGFSGDTQKLFASTLGNHPYFTKPLEIIVDKKNHRLGLVSGSILLRNYPVGLGGHHTPTGTFRLSIKVIDPNGKSNGEFGSRGMQLSDTNYAIHGTNEPDSIGADESLGCVRMSKADVEELFDMAPLGTKVTITNDVLPDDVSVPQKRYTSTKKPTQNQTDPSRTYHWLN